MVLLICAVVRLPWQRRAKSDRCVQWQSQRWFLSKMERWHAFEEIKTGYMARSTICQINAAQSGRDYVLNMNTEVSVIYYHRNVFVTLAVNTLLCFSALYSAFYCKYTCRLSAVSSQNLEVSKSFVESLPITEKRGSYITVAVETWDPADHSDSASGLHSEQLRFFNRLVAWPASQLISVPRLDTSLTQSAISG